MTENTMKITPSSKRAMVLNPLATAWTAKRFIITWTAMSSKSIAVNHSRERKESDEGVSALLTFSFEVRKLITAYVRPKETAVRTSIDPKYRVGET